MRTDNSAHGEHSLQPTERIRSWFRYGMVGLALVCAGTLVAILALRQQPHMAQDSQPAERQQVVVVPAATPQRAASPNGIRPAAQPPQPIQAVFPEPTPGMRQLVDNLANLEPVGGVMTPEQVAEWKNNLQQLVQQGSSAVPAIREFLAKNTDLDFSGGGKQSLGYVSARAAMIDALGQIGGPLAVATLSEVLQSTAAPLEIALLSQNLEKLEPGMHQQAALDAARQTLVMATEGNLANRDVAPLFEVFQQFPDAATVTELEANASRWNYYAMMALARLPNEEGIPSLIQHAQDSGNSAALLLLAQAAQQSDSARAALVEQARQNKLSVFSWAMLAPILAGSQVHYQDSAFDTSFGNANPNDVKSTYMPASNQSWYTVPTPGSLTVERAKQQAALIDELLSVTSDPASVQKLKQAKDLLVQRASQVASNSGS